LLKGVGWFPQQLLRCQNILVVVKKSAPLWPCGFRNIAEWCESSIVGNVEEIWAFANQEFDEFKIGLVCPASIMEGIATKVIHELDSDIRFGQNVVEQVGMTTTANGVHHCFFETVAG
jgi:hypothetical protein